MLLILVIGYCQCVFGFDLEIFWECCQFFVWMYVFYCQLVGFLVIEVVGLVGEVFQVVESVGNDVIEGVFGMEGFYLVVYDFEVGQFQFEFYLGQEVGFFVVVVEQGQVFFWEQDGQWYVGYVVVVVDIQLVIFSFGVRYDVQVVEQVV